MDPHGREAGSDDFGELRSRRRRCLDTNRLCDAGYPSDLVLQSARWSTYRQPLRVVLAATDKDTKQAAELLGIDRPSFCSAPELNDCAKLHPVARRSIKALKKCTSGGCYALEVSAFGCEAGGIRPLVVVERSNEAA